MSDYKFWRLIGRMKSSLGEPIEVVKELKLKEVRALLKINWQVEIAQCELVERTLCELVDDIFSKGQATEEERQFVRITSQAIADTLKRESKVKI